MTRPHALLLVLLAGLLGGCGISLSIGTDTQQIRSQFLCTDIAMKLLEMSRQYDMQMGLAGTPEHKQMLGRIADGFMDDYRALAAKDECWRKL